MELARRKLVARSDSTEFGSLSANARLAVVSTRLLLDFEPARFSARRTEEELVASHMRIAFSVPQHREFMRTGTPSEPILAEAAAQIMNMPGFDTLAILNQYLEDGLAPKGERGELVGRVLDILAIDSVITTEHQPSSSTDEIKYSKPISVISYLTHLFPDDVHRDILDSTPSNPRNIASQWRTIKLRDAFKDAYIHVTHYAKAGDNSVLEGKHLWAHWARGIAFQLMPGTDLSDRMLPIHWTALPRVEDGMDTEGDNPELKLSRDTCSAILHQDKNDPSKSISQVRSQNPEKLGMFGGQIDKKPIIAITNLYASNGGVRVGSGRRQGTPRASKLGMAPVYEIYAEGLCPDTYRVIKDEAMGGRLRTLLARGRVVDEHPRGENFVNAVRTLQPDHCRHHASMSWSRSRENAR